MAFQNIIMGFLLIYSGPFLVVDRDGEEPFVINVKPILDVNMGIVTDHLGSASVIPIGVVYFAIKVVLIHLTKILLPISGDI